MSKEVNYIGNLKGIVLCPIDRGKEYSYVLQGITEEQEEAIDGDGNYIFTNGSLNVKIEKRDIVFYGEIDIHNPEDVDIIKKASLVDHNMVHSWVPSNLNYDTGTVVFEGRVPKSYPTCDPVVWFKYCHCRIGKPKRVIAYKLKNAFFK